MGARCHGDGRVVRYFHTAPLLNAGRTPHSCQTFLRRNDSRVMYEAIIQKKHSYMPLMRRKVKVERVCVFICARQQAGGGGWCEGIISFPESGAVFHSSGQGNNYGLL